MKFNKGKSKSHRWGETTAGTSAFWELPSLIGKDLEVLMEDKLNQQYALIAKELVALDVLPTDQER